MKKKLIVLLTICLLLLSLVGCSKSYQESTNPNYDNCIGKGYFTTVKQWGSGMGYEYSIVYANDTKVMYFITIGGSSFGITPLYNADGTLQVYEGD